MELPYRRFAPDKNLELSQKWERKSSSLPIPKTSHLPDSSGRWRAANPWNLRVG